MERERIPIAQPAISKHEIAYVKEALRSGWISGKGKYVEEFEQKFAEWIGSEYAIATSSGTSALHLALASLGITSNDHVIIPAFSMAAIPFAVAYTGAGPVLADSEESTWNVDPSSIEQELTNRTKAIMVMHTYGHPADMDPISEIARKHELHVVEDAAEAHGAEYKGRKVGTIGDIGCFSLYANKIITTGEGGMITTSDNDLADRIRLLRDMAFRKDPLHRFVHECIAFNYRLTNIQAAVGIAQLERIEKFIEERRRKATLYTSLLKETKGITTPPESAWAKNVYWMYSVLVNEKEYGINRDQLIIALAREGIEARPFFTPVHLQPFAKAWRTGETYPRAERLGNTGLNLPSGNTLTSSQVKSVAEAIATLGKH